MPKYIPDARRFVVVRDLFNLVRQNPQSPDFDGANKKYAENTKKRSGRSSQSRAAVQNCIVCVPPVQLCVRTWLVRTPCGVEDGSYNFWENLRITIQSVHV